MISENHIGFPDDLVFVASDILIIDKTMPHWQWFGWQHDEKCVFRTKPITDSGRSRSLISYCGMGLD